MESNYQILLDAMQSIMNSSTPTKIYYKNILSATKLLIDEVRPKNTLISPQWR